MVWCSQSSRVFTPVPGALVQRPLHLDFTELALFHHDGPVGNEYLHVVCMGKAVHPEVPGEVRCLKAFAEAFSSSTDTVQRECRMPGANSQFAQGGGLSQVLRYFCFIHPRSMYIIDRCPSAYYTKPTTSRYTRAICIIQELLNTQRQFLLLLADGGGVGVQGLR